MVVDQYGKKKMKLVGVVLTYNCESFIERTIKNLPLDELDDVLFTDDGSTDKTIEIIKKNKLNYIQNSHLGYGGNLFNGLKKAFSDGATHVVELHGDGQYLNNNFKEIREKFNKNTDLVLGDRFYDKYKTFKSGMPFHIFIGNLFLSFLARIGLGFHLNDFFPGFRAYSKKFFEKIQNYNLSDGYQFSFEIIAISKLLELKISSVPSECNYKDVKQTAPLWYIFPCIYNLILRSIQFRLAKKGKKISVFNPK
ncbi:MAG: hypothetical protein CL556_10455 [Alphaproteobacteria bacterium]|nr:hypothetical protein [Alphaproteobacteria bacterium]|tara:strand:+ start:558 stop:1313 length:756 start_codon:yes stop_codon:yes gene_type:complete